MSDIINSSEYYQNIQMQAAAQRTASSKDSTMGMQDFMKLLVAQLQNQDPSSPMDNAQFIAQMAQFSSLQSINTMTELNTTSYAVSMIGKEVTTAVMDTNGMLVKTSGVVTGVTLFNGEPMIYIGDKSFAMASIMTVGEVPKTVENEEGSGDKGNTDEGSGSDDNGDGTIKDPPETGGDE